MEAQKDVPSRGLVGHLHFSQLFRQKTAEIKKILNSNML